MSSNSLKGLPPKDDESRDISSAASDYSDDSTSKTPIKPTQSPRAQPKLGLSPKGNHAPMHRENSADSDSLDNKPSSPFRLRKTSKQDHTEAHEDAPSVSSGYTSDDVNGDAASLTSPRTTRKTAGHDYDPKQYEDAQTDFHPVRNLLFSGCLLACLFISLFCLFVRLFTCLFVYLFVLFLNYLFVCSFACLFICLCVYLFVCLLEFVCLLAHVKNTKTRLLL